MSTVLWFLLIGQHLQKAHFKADVFLISSLCFQSIGGRGVTTKTSCLCTRMTKCSEILVCPDEMTEIQPPTSSASLSFERVWGRSSRTTAEERRLRERLAGGKCLSSQRLNRSVGDRKKEKKNERKKKIVPRPNWGLWLGGKVFQKKEKNRRRVWKCSRFQEADALQGL